MKWLRKCISGSLALWYAFRGQPQQVLTADDPPHTYTEHRIPEQEIWHEASNLRDGAKPRLIVGGTIVNLRQCVSHNVELIRSSGVAPKSHDFVITLREGFTSSFKSRKRGFAGTRIRLQFGNVSAGVNIFVPVSVSLIPSWPLTITHPPVHTRLTSGFSTGRLRLIATDNEGNVTPRFTPVPAMKHGLAAVTRRPEIGYAVYEVLDSNPNVVQAATIRVYTMFFAKTAQNRPQLGQSTVTVTVVDPAAPEGLAERNAFAINACSCNFLFPFVTNQDGSDTQIALANTSLDPFGTTTQRGCVTLHFYGNMADGSPTPQPIKTLPIPPGEQLVFKLSSGGNFGVSAVPGFRGYILAVVNFQYCHGIAFISGSGRTLTLTWQPRSKEAVIRSSLRTILLNLRN